MLSGRQPGDVRQASSMQLRGTEFVRSLNTGFEHPLLSYSGYSNKSQYPDLYINRL